MRGLTNGDGTHCQQRLSSEKTMLKKTTRLPAGLATGVISVAGLLCGCGPGYHVSPRSFNYCHPAVRWVYHTGWQVVSVAIPEVMPIADVYSNGILSMRRGDDCVVLDEVGGGDFVIGLWRPAVALDVETGRFCRCVPSDEESATVQLIGERMTCPIGNGLELRIESGPDYGRVAIFIGRETMEPSSFLRVFEASKDGFVDQWTLFEDQDFLLVTVNFVKFWTMDSDSYLLCIDLDALDLDLGDRLNTE